jgi:hypothetical protein
LRKRTSQGEAEKSAYVFGTPKYLSNYKTYRSVAVAAPTSCANLDAKGNSRGGTSRADDELLATMCGVEMNLLEAALVEQGYVVTSWRSIAQVGEGKFTSVLNAAKQAGAQVLFQVNALGRVRDRTAGDENEEYDWYRADSKGIPQEALTALTEYDINRLNALVMAFREARKDQQVLAVKADVTAIDVNTGQTLWIYVWTQTIDTSKMSDSELLVKGVPRSRVADSEGMSPNGYEWSPYAVPTVAIKSKPKLITRTERVGRQDKNEYDKLFKKLVRDLAAKFRTSRGRTKAARLD